MLKEFMRKLCKTSPMLSIRKYSVIKPLSLCNHNVPMSENKNKYSWFVFSKSGGYFNYSRHAFFHYFRVEPIILPFQQLCNNLHWYAHKHPHCLFDFMLFVCLYTMLVYMKHWNTFLFFEGFIFLKLIKLVFFLNSKCIKL